jgi:hypothetical protein
VIIPDAYTLIQLLTGKSFGNGLDDLTAAKTGNGSFSSVHSGYPQALQQLYVHKEGRIAGATYTPPDENGGLVSMWQCDGATYSGGAIPGSTWANPTNSTIGALGQANPGGGRSQFMLDVTGAIGATGGILWIYDRLGHVGGLSGTNTGAQNVNGGSAGTLSRYGSATNNFLACEIFTAVGGTATTITASYTNQAGSSGQTTQPVQIGGGTSRFQTGSFFFLSLASGDTGVQAVTSATVLASTGTAGSFGLVIGQMLYALVTTTSGMVVAHSFVDAPMPQVLSSACLAFAVQGNTPNVSPTVDLLIELAEK